MNKKLKIALVSSSVVVATAAISAGIIAYDKTKSVKQTTNKKMEVKQGDSPKKNETKAEIKPANILLALATKVQESNNSIESMLAELEQNFSFQKSIALEEFIKNETNDKLRNYYQKTLEYLRKNEKAKVAISQAMEAFVKFQQASEKEQIARTNYIKIVRNIEDLDELINDLKNGVVRKEIKYQNLTTVMDNGDYIHKRDLTVDVIGTGFKAYTSYKPIDLSNVEGVKSFRKLSQFVNKDIFDKNYLVEFSLPENILEIYGPKLANLKDEDKIGVLKSKTSLKVNKILKKYINNKLDEVVVEVFTPELLVSFNNKYIPIDEVANIEGDKKPDFYDLTYTDNFLTVGNKELKDKKEIIASYVNERKWLDFFVQLPKKDLTELQNISELPYGFNFRIKVVLE